MILFRQKRLKFFIQTALFILFSAALIIVGLGAAIYFIVADAIDRKIETCMYNHFHANNMLQKYNVTVLNQSSTTYSTDDCASIIATGRKRTNKSIDEKSIDECIKDQFRQHFVDDLMLMGFLNKNRKDGEWKYIQNAAYMGSLPSCPNAPRPGARPNVST